MKRDGQERTWGGSTSKNFTRFMRLRRGQEQCNQDGKDEVREQHCTEISLEIPKQWLVDPDKNEEEDSYHIESYNKCPYIEARRRFWIHCPSSILTQLPITMAENSGKDITSLSFSLWFCEEGIIKYLAHRVVVRVKWLTAS